MHSRENAHVKIGMPLGFYSTKLVYSGQENFTVYFLNNSLFVC